MTKADKEECFAAIKRSRESHDRFWSKYGELREERREAQRRRSEEFHRKQAAWRERVRGNIARNQEKLARAVNALSRTRERISEIEGKLYETNSAKWQGIFADWLLEARAKESDIEESVDRIRGWIQEDEEKLRSS